MIEAAVMLTPDGKTELLSFVNGSGHFGNSYFDPIPCSVSCDMAVPKAPVRVTGLKTGEALPYSYENGRLSLTLPGLSLYDAAVIEY